jgi:hypothetical protein
MVDVQKYRWHAMLRVDFCKEQCGGYFSAPFFVATARCKFDDFCRWRKAHF